MNIIDLSHTIHEKMPVYPGKNQPSVKKIANILNEGYRETELIINSHLGTHIDAPAHMFEDGKFLNQFPIFKFYGKAVIINVPEGTRIISLSFLESFEEDIKNTDYVLFNTGWGNYWGTDDYLKNYPVLDEEAAGWLATFMIQGIGSDTISPDPFESTKWYIHHLLLNEEIIVVENLVFPELVDDLIRGELYCFPLSFKNADGSPVRAVFKVEDE